MPASHSTYPYCRVIMAETTNQAWRRVVYIKWRASASRGEVARAMNVHKSFARAIPCVLSVTEGMTCTSMADGGGCYPGVGRGQQNREF